MRVSISQPGSFPKSLRGYVERALARCTDDNQKAACQAIMKEVSTRKFPQHPLPLSLSRARAHIHTQTQTHTERACIPAFVLI